MTEQDKRAAAQIINAPSKALDKDKFAEWLRLTLFYGAVGSGVAPSHAAIQLTVNNIVKDRRQWSSGKRQLGTALAVLQYHGKRVDEVLTELGY